MVDFIDFGHSPFNHQNITNTIYTGIYSVNKCLSSTCYISDSMHWARSGEKIFKNTYS